jgi:hypothetical protein
MKYFFTLIAICIISISTRSQSIIDTNKIWSVAECVWSSCGTTSFKFVGDTVIGSYQYKTLYGSNDSTLTNWYIYGAMREDTIGKIYYHNLGSGGEGLIYDFNLIKNDTFTVGPSTGLPWLSCPIELVVDSVDTVTLLNGEQRKRIIFHSPFGYQEEWIEGVGSLFGLVHVGYLDCMVDVLNELNCFTENDTLKYDNPIYSTCYFTQVGIEETSDKINIKLYPNPFNNFSTIELQRLKENWSWTLYNSIGQKVQHIDNITNTRLTIKKGNLSSGIYFYLVKVYDSRTAHGKLIIE